MRLLQCDRSRVRAGSGVNLNLHGNRDSGRHASRNDNIELVNTHELRRKPGERNRGLHAAHGQTDGIGGLPARVSRVGAVRCGRVSRVKRDASATTVPRA